MFRAREIGVKPGRGESEQRPINSICIRRIEIVRSAKSAAEPGVGRKLSDHSVLRYDDDHERQ